MILLRYESKSPLLPYFEVLLHKSQLDEETTKSLANIVITEEKNILEKTSKFLNDNDTWLTGRLWNYNFLDFDYEAIYKLKKFIIEQYDFYAKELQFYNSNQKIYVQCWANLVKNNGKKITPHDHSNAHSTAPLEYSYLSGNLCVQVEGTSTYYGHPIFKEKIYAELPNKNGELILFPSYLWHWADGTKSEIPRITISFDIITEEVYNMIDNKNYRQLK
jgi:hypothetical protein